MHIHHAQRVSYTAPKALPDQSYMDIVVDCGSYAVTISLFGTPKMLDKVASHMARSGLPETDYAPSGHINIPLHDVQSVVVSGSETPRGVRFNINHGDGEHLSPFVYYN